MEGTAADVARWQKEADFFDRWAAGKSAEQLGPIDRKVVARYRVPGKLHAKEFCCQLAASDPLSRAGTHGGNARRKTARTR